VRLLVDQNVAARVTDLLRRAGHDAVHVSERGLQRAEDDETLSVAVSDNRVIVSEDPDFGALLARSVGRAPSFVLIRSAAPMTPDAQALLLAAALPGACRRWSVRCGLTRTFCADRVSATRRSTAQIGRASTPRGDTGSTG
jgi:predicted nuclease of predicted toxin-antitoxin system